MLPLSLLPVVVLGIHQSPHHHHSHHEEWPGLRFHENQYHLKDESGGGSSNTEHAFAFGHFSKPLTIGATATASGDPGRALLLLSRMEGLARTHQLLDPQSPEGRPRLFGLRWESNDGMDSTFGAGVALRKDAKAPYHEDMTVLRNIRQGLYVTMRRTGLHSDLESVYNVIFNQVFPKFSLNNRTIEEGEQTELTEDLEAEDSSTEEGDPVRGGKEEPRLPSGSPILEEFHNVPSTAVTWSHQLLTECFVPIQSVPDGVHVQRL